MAKGEIAADLQSQYATFESSTVTRLPLFRTFLLLDLYLFCSLLAFFILASYHCYDLSLFFLFLYGSVHAAATAAAATAAVVVAATAAVSATDTVAVVAAADTAAVAMYLK